MDAQTGQSGAATNLALPTVSPNLPVDGSKGIDVAGLITGAAQTYGGQIAASKQDFAAATAKEQVAGQMTESAANAMAAAVVKTQTAIEEAKVTQRTDDANAAAAFGLNPHAANYTIASRALELTNIESDLNGRRKMIQDKQDSSFLDNPLGWIANQISLPYDVAAYNTRAGEYNTKESAIASLQALTQEQYKVNANIDVAAGGQKLAGLKEQTYATAAKEVAASRLQLAQMGVSNVTMRTALDRDQFNTSASVASVIAGQQSNYLAQQNYFLAATADQRNSLQFALQYGLSKDQFAFTQEQFKQTFGLSKDEFALRTSQVDLQKQEFGLRKDEFNQRVTEFLFNSDLAVKRYGLEERTTATGEKSLVLNTEKWSAEHDYMLHNMRTDDARLLMQQELNTITLADRSDNMNARYLLQDKLDRYSKVVGAAPITTAEYRQLDATSRADIDKIITDPNLMVEGRLGFNGADALQNTLRNRWPLTPDQRETVGKINDVANNAAVQYAVTGPGGGPGWNQMKPETQMLYKQRAIEDATNKELKAIPSTGGIYSPPPLNDVLNMNPLVGNNPLAYQLKVQAGKGPAVPFSGRQMEETAIQLAGLPTTDPRYLSPAMSAQIIAGTAVAIATDLDERHQYGKLVISPLQVDKSKPQYTGYNMLMPSIGKLSGSDEAADLTNAALMESRIKRAVISRAGAVGGPTNTLAPAPADGGTP